MLAEAEQMLAKGSDKAGPPLVAKATLSREGALWKLHLEIGSKDGSAARDLEDESCLRLAQVAALSLALAVDSSATLPPTRPVNREPAPAPPRFLIRALVGGDLGSLRAPSPGPGLALGLFLGRGRLEVVGNYWFAQSSQQIQDQLIAGGLHGCMAITEGPELGICAGLDAGRMEGRALDTGAKTVHAWLAFLAGAALGIQLTDWLALRVEASVGLTMVTPTFGAGSDGVRAAPVFGRLVGGVEAQLR